MRAPWTKQGDYKIKYIQVPFDNRYFLVFYYGQEIMRIPHVWIHIFESIAHERCWDKECSYDRFMNRVEDYNVWLDETNC